MPTHSARPAGEFAASQVDAQRVDFQRLGVMGDWDDPYSTMASRFEAEQLLRSPRSSAVDDLVPGFKPVHWRLDCRSSLAEAEVDTKTAIHLRWMCAFPSSIRSMPHGASD